MQDLPGNQVPVATLAGNVKAEETWVGSLFQTRDAVDEIDYRL